MIIFCNVKTEVCDLYLDVCMHLLKEGEWLVMVVYHHHRCSTSWSVLKGRQHNLQDKFITIKVYFVN